MNNLIKKRLVVFMAVAFFTICLTARGNAQEKSWGMKSSGLVDKEEMQLISGMIPLKAEDISPLLYGEKIPGAVLSDVSGKSFDLNKAFSEKPTVLVFYRGGWCPYCSRQLSGLQEALPRLEELGYQLIAISTDSPSGLAQSVGKEKLSYTLLSDADLALSKQVGIAFKAPKGYWEMLPNTTGGKDTDLLLPVPSVFIVDNMGMIKFEYINPDFKQRLDSNLLISVAKSVKKDL
ncbi:peroxiredoxin-like family protein [Sphingobacterium sp. HMA12]|uniref:peroxiredoxin-like family protein n=1 Tax=Sphingobacterium sp. HMA12 TaxID=2050894 RepID=UPI0018F83D0B|nr:peroxiredoxin-like family protein [Sphingobacterium sp. HMA12]